MSFINPRHTPLFDPEDALTSSELAFIQDLSSAASSDATAVPIISTGTSAPTTTPSVVGDIFVDTTNNTVYIATGIASSADWKELGAGGGSGSGTVTNVSVVTANGVSGSVATSTTTDRKSTRLNSSHT